MQISLRKESTKAQLSCSVVIRMVAFYVVTSQLLTVFRAAALYNTDYISNVLRLFISTVLIFKFFFDYFNCRATELIFVSLPVVGLVVGVLNEQIGRDYFSDFFNAMAFAVVIIHYRKNPQCITKSDLEYLAKWELIGTAISFLTYKVFPLFGYPITSVGIVSNYLLFPLAFFLSYKSKWWIVAAIMIAFGGKRGVMISAIALMCYYFIFDKKGSIRGIVAVVFAASLLSAGLYFTESPQNVELLPKSLQGVAYRFMKINPLSDKFDLHSDGRLDEVEGALNSFNITPVNLILGKGNGFVYDHYHDGVLRFQNRHNVHFTPISFLTRYGIIYMLCFYANYLWILYKATKQMYRKRDHKYMMCITLFLVGSFVDQFTVFLPYSDYQFMICFGIMNGMLHNNDYEENIQFCSAVN